MSKYVSQYFGTYSTDGLTPAPNGGVLVQPMDGTFTISAATYYSVPVDVRFMDRYRMAFTCPSTGAPAGNVKLQACNDDTPSVNRIPGQFLINWIDLGFNLSGVSTVLWPVSNATQIALDEVACNYAWVRMVATLSGGTVLPTVRFMNKGDGGR